MYDYEVIFIWGDRPFHEHTTVYGVKNRREAIKCVKEHYGTWVKIVSATRKKE